MFPISSVEDPPLEGAAPPASPAGPAAAAPLAPPPPGPSGLAASAPAASAGPTATTNVATTAAAAAAVPPPPAGPIAAAATAVALAAVGPPHTWPRPARSAVGVSPQNNLQGCTKCKRWKEGWRFTHVVLGTPTERCDLCREEARALDLWNRVDARL
ncbi:hypothetical protein N7488_001787 [Penicillium malachiteum]|nr:hypothetical protein N7488_001787 [Penicillium malachiteum]